MEQSESASVRGRCPRCATRLFPWRVSFVGGREQREEWAPFNADETSGSIDALLDRAEGLGELRDAHESWLPDYMTLQHPVRHGRTCKFWARPPR